MLWLRRSQSMSWADVQTTIGSKEGTIRTLNHQLFDINSFDIYSAQLWLRRSQRSAERMSKDTPLLRYPFAFVGFEF